MNNNVNESSGNTSTEKFWELFFDGAAMPTNPGPRGIGALVISPEGELFSVSRGIGFGSNNEAEYSAVIEGMRLALSKGAKRIIAKGDSALVVNQLSGNWQVRTESLLGLFNEAMDLKSKFSCIQFCWIPREENKEADKLSKDGVRRGSFSYEIEEDKVWGNQNDIGKELGISAVAVGKFLDRFGLRENKRPTRLACDGNFARIYGSLNFFQSDWCIPSVAELYQQKKCELEQDKNRDESHEWGTLSDIGKKLNISAIAVGKFLADIGARDAKFPTPKACELGLARDRSERMFYQKEWKIQAVVDYYNKSSSGSNKIIEQDNSIRWMKITDIGKEIGVSAKEIGAFLDKTGMRADGLPIKEELNARHARLVGDVVHPQSEWDADYVSHKYNQMFRKEQATSQHGKHNNSELVLAFKIHSYSEPSAGIEFFGDNVIVRVESGSPGGDPGEFEKAMAEFLSEWYQSQVTLDGATMSLETEA